MRWPWSARRTETRSGYTSQVVSAILAAATETGDDSPLGLSAVDVAAGAYARAFAAAVVEPASPTLTPGVLAHIARCLIRTGESLHLIDVDQAGRVRLRPSAWWHVHGGSDPAGWRYDLSLVGPDTTERRIVPAAAVLHCRLAFDAARPWAGVAPLTWAARTGRLAARLERATGDEAGAPTGQVLPVPEGQEEGEESPLKTLLADLRKLRGNLTTVETTARGYGDAAAALHSDW